MYSTPKERASKTAQDDVFQCSKIIRFSSKEKVLAKLANPLFVKTFVMKTKLFYFEN